MPRYEGTGVITKYMQSMLTLWSEMLFWQCAFGYIPSQPPQQQIIGPAHYQDRGVDPIKHIYWQTKHLICTCAFKCVAFRTLLVTLVKVHLCFIIMILGNRFYYLASSYLWLCFLVIYKYISTNHIHLFTRTGAPSLSPTKTHESFFQMLDHIGTTLYC